MDKPIRRAVRVFIKNEDKVVVIKYKTENLNGYYDIPGGKIEKGETPEQTAVREAKEETGLLISNPRKIGRLIIEYPDKIFDFDVFITSNFEGKAQNFDENNSMWCKISQVLKYEKVLPTIELLKHLNNNVNLKLICDKNHNILNVRKIN